MDEIYIPLAKEVSGATYEMVDRFSSYAEALSVPVFKDKGEGFIAVAKHILKKTTKQHHDVDNLFRTLQKVTLTLVGEQLKKIPMTAYTKDRLPEPTRLQKQAAETKVQSFDDVWITRIKNRSFQIRQMVEKHKVRMRKLIAAQELCWKTESKYREINLTMETSIRSRNFLLQKRRSLEADMKTRNKQIEKLSNKLCKMSEMVADHNFEFQEKVGYEIAARTNLHKMSEELCESIKYVIAERLSYGIGCLRDVIEGFNDVDKYEECLQHVGEIDLPKIVNSILTACSEKYICPRINEYIETYGFKTQLPIGKIVPGNDVISGNIGNKDGKTNTEKKKKQSEPKKEEGVTKAQSQHGKSGDETEIRQEEDASVTTTNPDKKKDPVSSDDEQEISEAAPSGLVLIKNYRTYVMAPEKVAERAPGLLKLKKGLRIKQKIQMSDVDLCFGWSRPHMFSAKVWGFYYKHQVQKSEI